VLAQPAAGVRIEVVGRLAYGRRNDGTGSRAACATTRATSRLRVRGAAASLTLTANGVELARVRDREPLLSVTGAGLFVASTSGDAGATFDDLLVEVLD